MNGSAVAAAAPGSRLRWRRIGLQDDRQTSSGRTRDHRRAPRKPDVRRRRLQQGWGHDHTSAIPAPGEHCPGRRSGPQHHGTPAGPAQPG
jgi:hypothetical protein